MYKDPIKQAEYYTQYWKSHREQKKEYLKKRGLLHKRVYTDGGGEWKCALCGTTWDDGAELHIHHKDQINSNNDFNNLVCLCRSCHEKVHNNWIMCVKELVDLGIVDWTGVLCQKITEIKDSNMMG